MSGAIMNKVWDLFGMDNAEDKDENEYEYEDYEQPEEEVEEKILGKTFKIIKFTTSTTNKNGNISAYNF